MTEEVARADVLDARLVQEQKRLHRLREDGKQALEEEAVSRTEQGFILVDRRDSSFRAYMKYEAVVLQSRKKKDRMKGDGRGLAYFQAEPSRQQKNGCDVSVSRYVQQTCLLRREAMLASTSRSIF